MCSLAFQRYQVFVLTPFDGRDKFDKHLHVSAVVPWHSGLLCGLSSLDTMSQEQQ
jgi:hypothetical protein